MRKTIFFMSVLLLSSCASVGFVDKYYTNYLDKNSDLVIKDNQNKEIEIYPMKGVIDKPENMILVDKIVELESQGYSLLGESSYCGGGLTSEDEVKNWGKQIGAQVALFYSGPPYAPFSSAPKSGESQNHVGMNQGINTVKTLNSAIVNGGSFSDTFLGLLGSGISAGMSSGNGSQPQRECDKYNYETQVYYFVKTKICDQRSFGLSMIDIPMSMKRKIKRNTGAFVFSTCKNSPIYKANIVVGDIITKINNKDVLDTDSALKLFSEAKNKKSVKIEVLRPSGTKIFNVMPRK